MECFCMSEKVGDFKRPKHTQLGRNHSLIGKANTHTSVQQVVLAQQLTPSILNSPQIQGAYLPQLPHQYLCLQAIFAICFNSAFDIRLSAFRFV